MAYTTRDRLLMLQAKLDVLAYHEVGGKISTVLCDLVELCDLILKGLEDENAV